MVTKRCYIIKICSVRKYHIFILCYFFSFIGLKSFAQPSDEIKAGRLFEEAEQLFFINPPSLKGYHQAFALYDAALKLYQAMNGHALQTANCHLRMGALYQTFGQWKKALNAYRQSIAIKMRLPALSDSLLLDEYVYSGNIHYITENFDSAAYYYYLAEDISAKYNADKKWLYNSMGLLHFSTGNYDQSINYYTKTLEVLDQSDPFYESDVVAVNSNLALSNSRLGHYQNAIAQYKKILNYEIDENTLQKVLLNLGGTYYLAGNYKNALASLRKVIEGRNILLQVDALNIMGGIFLATGQNDSAAVYLNHALALNKQKIKSKNLSLSETCLGLARLAEAGGNLETSLQHYQDALTSTGLDFDDTDITKNPGLDLRFISLLSLFEILQGKAHAFFAYYLKNRNLSHARHALETYDAAIRVAQQLQKTYDTDDAKLFFVQKVYPMYEEALQSAFQLYEETGKQDFQHMAFEIAEISRATVLTEMLNDLDIKAAAGIDPGLLQEEKRLKQQITALRLKITENNDTALISSEVQRVNDLEISLSRTIRSLQSNPEYYALKYQQDTFNLAHIQEVMEEDDVIIEYFLGDGKLFIFLIAKDGLQIKRIKLPGNFVKILTTLQHALYEHKEGQSSEVYASLNQLYQVLIGPISGIIKDKKRLIIVPDGQLSFLPFEMLTAGNNKNYLLKDFTIAYAYSATLLGDAIRERNAVSNTTILAMAPFIGDGKETVRNGLDPLPKSKEEVEKLGGSIYLKEAATKEVFLKEAGSYGIIHLATHAQGDNEKPLNSYIAFYPKSGATEAGHRLYTDELYNLRLDSAQLIILSACETGGGKLVKGEGIISLARAFAYAGCPNIITTLWQASDQASATITKNTHKYLKKGYPKDKALRLAKLDYLADEPLHQDPYYWANFIFIGDPAPIYPKTYFWWYLGGAILMLVPLWIFRKNLFRKLLPD